MKEDKLTNSLVNTFTHQREEPLVDKDGNVVRTANLEMKAIPEVHYNHYGTRGVADLFVRKELERIGQNDIKDRVIEVKSDPQNANEVIRQFNRMRKYFYKGSEYGFPDKVTFELCFTAEKKNLEHVEENLKMYRSLVEQNDNVMVVFRHPENTTPVHAVHSRFDVNDQTFWDCAKVQGFFEEVRQ